MSLSSTVRLNDTVKGEVRKHEPRSTVMTSTNNRAQDRKNSCVKLLPPEKTRNYEMKRWPGHVDHVPRLTNHLVWREPSLPVLILLLDEFFRIASKNKKEENIGAF